MIEFRLQRVEEATLAEHAAAIYVHDLSAQPVTGLDASSFEISVALDTGNGFGFSPIAVSVTVAELDPDDAPGWYRVAWTPTGRGLWTVTLSPLFAGHAGAYRLAWDLRANRPTAPDYYIVAVVGDQTVRIPAYVGPLEG
jgi:hypothetical protein